MFNINRVIWTLQEGWETVMKKGNEGPVDTLLNKHVPELGIMVGMRID